MIQIQVASYYKIGIGCIYLKQTWSPAGMKAELFSLNGKGMLGTSNYYLLSGMGH